MAPSSSLHIVTPLIRSDRLTDLMGGVPVFLKLENLQPSGSFKIRGIGHTCSEAKANGAVKIVGRYVQNLQLSSMYVVSPFLFVCVILRINHIHTLVNMNKTLA